jgi:hypothetical protein
MSTSASEESERGIIKETSGGETKEPVLPVQLKHVSLAG